MKRAKLWKLKKDFVYFVIIPFNVSNDINQNYAFRQTKQNSNKTESKSDCVSCGVNISEETVGFVYTVLSNTRSFSNRPNNPHPGPLNTTLT